MDFQQNISQIAGGGHQHGGRVSDLLIQRKVPHFTEIFQQPIVFYIDYRLWANFFRKGTKTSAGLSKIYFTCLEERFVGIKNLRKISCLDIFWKQSKTVLDIFLRNFRESWRNVFCVTKWAFSDIFWFFLKLMSNLEKSFKDVGTISSQRCQNNI